LGEDNDPGTIPPSPPPLAPVSRSFAQQFFDFLNTFAIIGLAIAFVIGAAASKLVTAFVEDIINPTVGLSYLLVS
jgi:large-conductance mechanosensitive channel